MATGSQNMTTFKAKGLTSIANTVDTSDFIFLKSTAFTADQLGNTVSLSLNAVAAGVTGAAVTNNSLFLNAGIGSGLGTPFQLQIPDSSHLYIYKRWYTSDAWSEWSKISAGHADDATKITSTPNNTTTFLRGDNTWTNTLGGAFTANGTITANGGYLTSTVNGNTVQIGSQNTGFCHITNSANIPFWFNKDIQIDNGKIIGGAGTQYRPYQLYLGRYTTNTNTLNAATPLIEFSNSDRSQYCQLIYSDYDSVVAPDSLTLLGNQAGTHFIAPKVNVGGYINDSYALSTASFICNSWIRTVGSTGWYNESYGGGLYMADAKWIRNYNYKPLLIDINTNNSYGIGGHRLALGLSGASHTSILLKGGDVMYGFCVNNDGNWYFGRRTSKSFESTSGDAYLLYGNSTTFYPYTDNSINLGTSTRRWATCYANAVYVNCVWANQGSNGERRVATDSATSGNLYLYSNPTEKGIYSGSGYQVSSVLKINSTGKTFYGGLVASESTYGVAGANMTGLGLQVGSSLWANTGITNGNADGASTKYCNLFIKSWNGVGFVNGCGSAGRTGANSITVVIDCRQGNIEYVGSLIKSSSRSIKRDILPLKSYSDIIDKLQPVSFIYTNDPLNRITTGLIYEDTLPYLPEICLETSGKKTISYVDLIPILLKEIQELRLRVSQLELKNK